VVGSRGGIPGSGSQDANLRLPNLQSSGGQGNQYYNK